jgi:energy-converting hydrogenase Eha subunit A
VFKRLNEEPFSRSGVFSSPENAKSYYENMLKIAEEKPHARISFESKLTGYAQEVDWLRKKQGEISSIYQKSTLFNSNEPGVDGETVNRFTGKTINRTTVKASINPMTKNSTGIKGIKEAIEKGTATEKDIIFGPKGTKAAAKAAGLKNPVIEKNSAEQIRTSNSRLEHKIVTGRAVTAPTLQQIGQKTIQGAVVGAAVAITVSAITTYVRYKNGELTRDEAFRDVAEDTLKGALVGAALGGVTIFLPVGVIGYVAGMAIGVYFSRVCTNILDEVFGKGAYGAILNASGYVYGMTSNLAEYYKKIKSNLAETKTNLETAEAEQRAIEENFKIFEKMKGE